MTFPGECGRGVQHPLFSARLRLRPVVEADAPVLACLANDWQVARYTKLPFPYEVSDAQAFVGGHRKSGVVMGLERLLDKAFIGCVGAHCDDAGSYELGYWLGYATEAARRFVRHLFEDVWLTGLWSSVNNANAASVHVVNKLGMNPDGQVAVAFPNRAEPLVLPRYALSREQWAAVHGQRPKVLVAAAALIDSDGRVLMATRPKGKSMAGLWEFPGGKVHEDETPEQALKRELSEELGVETGLGCMAPIAFASHDYDTFHLLMPLYAIRVWSGHPVPREGQELKWIAPDKMMDLPMPPADIPLVAMLREWV